MSSGHTLSAQTLLSSGISVIRFQRNATTGAVGASVVTLFLVEEEETFYHTADASLRNASCQLPINRMDVVIGKTTELLQSSVADAHDAGSCFTVKCDDVVVDFACGSPAVLREWMACFQDYVVSKMQTLSPATPDKEQQVVVLAAGKGGGVGVVVKERFRTHS